MHGTSVGGQDDRDEMGVCLEPPAFVTGLARVPAGTGTDRTVRFEQYERHTAWDRTGGVAVSLDDVLSRLTDADHRLSALASTTSVPAEPDRAWVDGWLHRSHLAYWDRLA